MKLKALIISPIQILVASIRYCFLYIWALTLYERSNKNFKVRDLHLNCQSNDICFLFRVCVCVNASDVIKSFIRFPS